MLNKIGATIDVMIGSASSEVITRTRYKEALRDVLECLDRFTFENIIELSAEDIRLAARSLGIITGRIDVEELLDRIISIGKSKKSGKKEVESKKEDKEDDFDINDIDDMM